MESDSPSASERQWLWMPVVCTICLIIAVFVGCFRIGRIWFQDNAVTSRWHCMKWVLRINYGVGLVAGALGLADSLRRFYVHRELARDANAVFLVFPILTYAFLAGSVGFISLGRLCQLQETRASGQAYQACKQNAGISFLAGLSAGITQELLSGFDDKEFPMPDAWRESCQMLGGSCGLICICLFVAQVDGWLKRHQQSQNPQDVKSAETEALDLTRQESVCSIMGDSFLGRLKFTAPEPPEANWAQLGTRQESLHEPLLPPELEPRSDSETGGLSCGRCGTAWTWQARAVMGILPARGASPQAQGRNAFRAALPI
eukprot:Skav205542  [mRNA]  locus=scaffold1012:126227:127177:- [translate_table: standard]